MDFAQGEEVREGKSGQRGESDGVERGISTVLAIAAVYLEGFLVAVDVDLDAAPGALESCHGKGLTPVVGAVLLACDKVCSI